MGREQVRQELGLVWPRTVVLLWSGCLLYTFQGVGQWPYLLSSLPHPLTGAKCTYVSHKLSYLRSPGWVVPLGEGGLFFFFLILNKRDDSEGTVFSLRLPFDN